MEWILAEDTQDSLEPAQQTAICNILIDIWVH